MSFFYSPGVADQQFVNTVNQVLARPDFCLFAEEAGALGSNNFEWAFGNGDDSPSGFGITLPFDCQLLAITLDTVNGSGTVEARRNQVSTGLQVTSDGNDRHAVAEASGSINFDAGDVLGFRTVTAMDAGQGGKVAAWFKWRV